MDIAYQKISLNPKGDLQQKYGDNVYLSASTYHLSLLAKFCNQQTPLIELFSLTRDLYRYLFSWYCDRLLNGGNLKIPTRMSETHPEGYYQGQFIDNHRSLVLVNLARAGAIPTQQCFELASALFPLEKIRQDHIAIARQADSYSKVQGSEISSAKVGGTIQGADVIFPDPMGATGNSLAEVINYYKNSVTGAAHRYIALNLIVTPEYLAYMKKHFPDTIIFAIRLDRGLSPLDVLKQPLGEQWQREVGLNQQDYIVPGAGGIGEILNNSFV